MLISHLKLNKNNYGEILLKKVDINGNLCAGYGEITINQIYENVGKKDIEGVYAFPIPDTAVISGFEAEIGGKTLKAVVEDKSKANKIYENARRSGDTTFSLEEFSPHFFKINIGKIISGEKVKIKFSYMDELDYAKNEFKLTIPAISEPKIFNKDSASSVKNFKSEDFEFKINIIVESLTNLEFKSPYHNIRIDRDGETIAKISLDEKSSHIDKDFTIIMREKETLEADGMIYEYKKNDEKKGIVYIRMIPKLDKFELEGNKNYVFLIDISYTMEGEKLNQAKNALHLCIRNLSEGDTFDIVAMGNKLYSFSKGESLGYNAQSLREASKWIDDLNTELSSDIFEGIKYSLEKGTKENTILIFTDDQVNEEDKILSYVKENVGDNRIFAFGVGEFVNNHFLNKLSHESSGKSEFIGENERIEDIVVRQLNRIQNPQVDNIKIDWGRLKVEASYPRTIKYMYDRELFSIFASVVGEVEGHIVLSGNVNESEYLSEIDIDNFNTEENANLLKKVWARKRIKSIEAAMKAERGKKREAMRKKIIQISKENEIISSETTFILMELREEPVLGIQLRNIIPIKVSEKTLGEQISIKSKSGFFYKTCQENIIDDNSYLHNKYPRERLLRIIAKNQFADGSFVDYEDSSLEDKVETTSMSILAFCLGKENIDIYLKQLNKAVVYICENYWKIDFHSREDINKLVFLALITIKRRNIIKAKYMETVDCTINNMYNIKELSGSIINGSLNKSMASLFNIDKKNKCIKEDITIYDERNSIFDMAKLSVLMSLNG
ncbi:VIT and vWA domain-containing protein [Clostridium tyrobutyricum]|uniref:VIT and vWA domain-containing protein n=1 Tax=Clostridium tyrobutyricum TaxID=1519 RepID=UPI001C394923|nr:VIT and VWA domain-containing protein [Clostridium tyrobutyricum]MBV4439982.1 VIT and VWA domain-containing protein [Clostridium tyrobutyricum]